MAKVVPESSAEESARLWECDDPLPEECKGCYALDWSLHGRYFSCGVHHDELDDVSLSDGVKPPSCKGIVKSYEEERIRGWRVFPYLYMWLMDKEKVEIAKDNHKTCCECGSKDIAYKSCWGHDYGDWLCAKCAKKYFKRMKNPKNWHSEECDVPRVKSVGLPRGSGGNKGNGEGGPGIYD